jgi:Fe-S cluster biogenesis protein NfuA/NifU-like protein involved in Fe-S cluster formation
VATMASADQPGLTSERVRARLRQPLFVGELTAAQAQARGGTLIVTEHGAESGAAHVRLTLLVDAAGVVRDARVASANTGEALVFLDVMAEMCVGLPLSALATITLRQVDARLRDDGGGAVVPAVAAGAPEADQPFYVLCKAAERSPAAAPAGPERPWSEIELFEKVRRIEAVLDAQVRPALASDGGGIDLVDLQGDELSVQYQGACGNCSAAIGGTLQFVQDSLNNHLGTNLKVTVAGLGEGMLP